jgi:hypothetical protein
LYALLEQQIIPTFHHRDQQGVPVHWQQRSGRAWPVSLLPLPANRAIRQ